MGAMDGKVTFTVDSGNLSGTIYFMNNENAFSGGTIDQDGNVAFKGDLKTPIGKMAYTITGTFINGQINATAKTKMGDLAIKSK